MTHISSLNPHERPPDIIRLAYKRYQKLSLPDIDADNSIIDPQSLDLGHLPAGICLTQWMSSKDLGPAFDRFNQGGSSPGQEASTLDRVGLQNTPVFTHQSVSGQHLLPGFGTKKPAQPNQQQGY